MYPDHLALLADEREPLECREREEECDGLSTADTSEGARLKESSGLPRCYDA